MAPRDLSTSQGKVEFICNCFEYLSWFATSFTSGVNIDPNDFISSAKQVRDQTIVLLGMGYER